MLMLLQTQSGFYIGPLFVYFYGIVYALGTLSFYWLLSKRKDKLNITQAQVDELVIFVLLGLIICGRLFHFIVNSPSTFVNDPVELLRFRNGGMSFFGALIGIISGVSLWYRRQSVAKNNNGAKNAPPQIRFYEILDLGSIVATIFLTFGRIANFLNQELVGTIADRSVISWCVEFGRTCGEELCYTGCRHPYQLYAAFSHFVLAAILIFLVMRRAKSGTTFYSFLIGYGLFRLITDFWRDDATFALGLTIWQWFSVILCIIGIALLMRQRANHAEKHKH